MHVPVLLQEVLVALDPQPGQFVIDGTLGAGGHTRAIASRLGPNGVLLALDRDPRAVAAFDATTLPQSVQSILVAGSYATLPAVMQQYHLPLADGLLLDLGFSSEQIAGGALAGRGFSFNQDEPLLMTYDDATPSLAERLADLSPMDLASIIREYGEERYAPQIATSIGQRARTQGIATTFQLVEAIKAAVPASYEKGRLHPATRTFQALRIYVNDELHQLEQLLIALPTVVRPGGRVAIISFHSLEDRIVKQYFKKYRDLRNSDGCSVDQTGETPNSIAASQQPGIKKPIIATGAESLANPRSRSAKLRLLILP